jgi:hypothetical protein
MVFSQIVVKAGLKSEIFRATAGNFPSPTAVSRRARAKIAAADMMSGRD